jgi:hypothetical protein
MNQLDLTRLNYRSPYQVWEGERGYCFKTDHGIFYTVEFDPEESGIDIIAYWFNLTNNSHKSSPNDVKIRDTVLCLIEEFFRVNPEILLYMCESGDGHQAMRARLFLRWFNQYNKNGQFYICTAEVKNGKITDYVALIIQRTHPAFNDIVELFDSEITMFQRNKAEEAGEIDNVPSDTTTTKRKPKKP